MDRVRENAKRIANALDRNATDSQAVSQLARLLNYEPRQLQKDIQSLVQYIRNMELEGEEGA